jgi:citronellol/citronellal dehydrogenase
VAIEWAPLGIQINCVAPGIIATEGMNVYSPEARGALPKTFITGTVIAVDGGNEIWGDQWTIPRPDWFNTASGKPNPPSIRRR